MFVKGVGIYAFTRSYSRQCEIASLWQVRDRGLVFRSSTGLESGNVIAGMDDLFPGQAARSGQASTYFFQFVARPAHAAYLDLAIRRDQEQSGNVGQPVSVRNGISFGIVEC